MTTREAAPTVEATAFNCPLCGAYAQQRWLNGLARDRKGNTMVVGGLLVALCAHCNEWSVWFNGAMVFPVGVRQGAPAIDGMPEDVRRLYDEARDVSAVSPRSAAALLRLALQVLVDELEPGNRSLNDKIGDLVRRGLSPEIAKAMDVVRVVGNNSVHPGQIEVDADASLAPSLFAITNLIVEQVIVRAATVDALFEGLPGGAKAAIERRDGVSTPVE